MGVREEEQSTVRMILFELYLAIKGIFLCVLLRKNSLVMQKITK